MRSQMKQEKVSKFGTNVNKVCGERLKVEKTFVATLLKWNSKVLYIQSVLIKRPYFKAAYKQN